MDKLPKICFNCPLSVSNKNPYCKTIGNKATGKLIVLPNLQKRDKGSIYNNKGYEIISNIYKELFNKDILDDYAITCLVRCAPYEDYVRKEEINRCYTSFTGEFTSIEHLIVLSCLVMSDVILLVNLL